MDLFVQHTVQHSKYTYPSGNTYNMWLKHTFKDIYLDLKKKEEMFLTYAKEVKNWNASELLIL